MRDRTTGFGRYATFTRGYAPSPPLGASNLKKAEAEIKAGTFTV